LHQKLLQHLGRFGHFDGLIVVFLNLLFCNYYFDKLLMIIISIISECECEY